MEICSQLKDHLALLEFIESTLHFQHTKSLNYTLPSFLFSEFLKNYNKLVQVLQYRVHCHSARIRIKPLTYLKTSNQDKSFSACFQFFSYHFVYFADQMKLFFLNSSSSKTGRMFTLHTLIRSYKIYLLAKFQPDYVIFVCFTDQNDFSRFGP